MRRNFPASLLLCLLLSVCSVRAAEPDRLVERFLRYVRIDTQSQEDTGKTPSTQKQLDLARVLAEELRGLGL